MADPSGIRLIGPKTELLRTPVAAASIESAIVGVRSFYTEMARPTRFERVTPAFGGRYSIHLSYGRVLIDMQVEGSK